MEYIMINRTLKAGGNNPEIPTPATLGRQNCNNNRLTPHHNINNHLNPQQQQQQLSTTRAFNNSTTTTASHGHFGTLSLPTSAVASGGGGLGNRSRLLPAKINVSLQSKSPLMNRISMSSSTSSSIRPPSSSSYPGTFSPSKQHHSRKDNNICNNSAMRRNINPRMTARNFHETSDFDSEAPVLLIGASPPRDNKPSKAVQKRMEEEEEKRKSNLLWENTVEPNGVLKKYRKLKFRSVSLASQRAPPPPMPKSSTTSALVSILRKRKACNNVSPNSSSSTGGSSSIVGNNLFPSNHKKPKLSFGPISFKSEFRKNNAKGETLTSKMPNLMKTVGSLKKRQSLLSCSSSSGDLYRRKTVPGRHPSGSSQSNALAVIGARPSIPTENVFLKKYDPLRLLSRLRSASPSSSKTPHANLAGIPPQTEPRKIIRNSNYAAPSPKKKSQKNKKPKKARKSKAKKNSVIAAHHTLFSSGSQDGTLMRKRKIKSKYRPKWKEPKVKERMDIKFFEGQRKHHIKYMRSRKNISAKRLRVLAAVSLKRALKTLRKHRSGKSKRRQHQNTKLQLGSHAPSSSVRASILKMLEASRSETRNGEIKPDIMFPMWPSNDPTVAKGQLKLSCHRSKPPPARVCRQILFPTPGNPYMLHTVELLRHKRQLQERNEAMESNGVVYKLDPQPLKPAIPTRNSFLRRNFPLNDREAKHVLSQQLLLNLAHSGFTHAKLRPLEVLADATESFLSKMCLRLKEIYEMEMQDADHQFSDPMERMLTEIGFGGVRGLQDFYRSKVKEFGLRMGEQCLLLRRQYAYKVRSKIGLGNSTSTSTSSTPSNGISVTPTDSGSVSSSSGNGSNASGSKAVIINSSKSACITNTTSSSQPLSPGNSVLAEMLSSQEELQQQQVRPVQCQASPLSSVGVEKQLEELMGAGAAPPPNVEIRPNSFPSRQQLPLLTSLSQPGTPQGSSPNPAQGQSSHPPLHIVQSSQSLQRPLRTIAVQQQKGFPQQQQQQQQQLFHLGQNQGSQPLQQSSLQGQQQQSVSLTQLLQRPIANQGSPAPATPTGLPQQSPQQQQHHIQGVVIHGSPQQQSQHVPTLQAQTVSQQQQHHPPPTGTPQQMTQRSLSVSSGPPGSCRQVLAIPIQMNMTRNNPGLSPLSSHDQLTTANPMVAGCPTSIKSTSTTRGKTVTIIRSGSSPGITVSSDKARLVNSNQSTAANSPASIDVFSEYSPINNTSNPPTPTFHHQLQHSGMSGNVISINLGSSSIDLDTGGGGVPQPQTVTMHAVEATTLSQSPNSNSASKAKLKETINQRNLLRLNFEQVPNAGDSTVLLSSSSSSSSSAPTSSAAGTTLSNSGNVQFLGKVSSGQTISWSSNYQ